MLLPVKHTKFLVKSVLVDDEKFVKENYVFT